MANPIDFDPRRAANWFGGIARAIRDNGVNWASIDNLADRTLRAMNILTRSRPRERLIGEIKKAIKTLCRQGILREYRPGTVRVNDPERLDRYIDSKPKPLSAEVDTAASKRAKDEPPIGSAPQRSHDALELGYSSPLGLPPLAALTDDGEEEDSPNPASVDEDDDPERAAIRLLVGASTARSTGPDREASIASSHTVPNGAVPWHGQFLDELAASLRAASSSWQVSVEGNVLTGSWHKEMLRIDMRRDGSLRGVLEFAAADLAAVLRRIRSSWQLASVGVDSRGVPALLYRWAAATAAADVIDDIERGLDLLDDARADV
jgi:hypothetical protein